MEKLDIIENIYTDYTCRCKILWCKIGLKLMLSKKDQNYFIFIKKAVSPSINKTVNMKYAFNVTLLN